MLLKSNYTTAAGGETHFISVSTNVCLVICKVAINELYDAPPLKDGFYFVCAYLSSVFGFLFSLHFVSLAE